MKRRETSVLANCAARDLHRRFSILRGEIDHLMRSIKQRQAHDLQSYDAEYQITDESAFLSHLFDASRQLSEDIKSTLSDSKRLLSCFDGPHFSTLNEYHEHRLLTGSQLFTIEQAVYRLKANVLSERIGNLHDRLDQFLERSNPDHPGPTRRRRSEQGIQDKYLSELSRWLYRDLARFASDSNYLGESYPFDKVPPVFQFWDYARASRHHSYITHAGYEKWRVWRSNDSKSRAQNSPLNSSEKFAALRLPYWIPECPELHPIIAHELAHQVLRDIYGYEIHFGDLEREGGHLDRMLRRLYMCIEEWTAEVDETRGGVYRPLPIEILCDAMAASRCGVAYLYALYIEFLDNDVLADLAKDHSGMLESIPESSNDQFERNRNLFLQSETLIDRQVTWLLRMSATLGYVRKVFAPQGIELQFCDELEQHIFEVLALYASGDTRSPKQSPIDTAYYRHFTGFAKDIVHALTTSGRRRAKTPLVVAAESFNRPTGVFEKDHFIDRQSLSLPWAEVFSSYFPETRASFNNECLLTAMDLPWMGIWTHLKKNPTQTYARLPNILLNAIDAAREDYVFRTANPRPLFSLLGLRIYEQEFIESSTLNQARLKSFYIEELAAIRELERCAGTNLDFSFTGTTFKIHNYTSAPIAEGKPLNHFLGRIFSSSEDVKRCFDGKSRFRLDLLSINADKKRDCYKSNHGTVVQSLLKGLVLASQVLLGRYDAFVLIPRRENDSPDEPSYHINSGARYTSRSRNLIYTPYPTSDKTQAATFDLPTAAKNSVAVVLIGLQWPGLRLPFLHWIQGDKIVCNGLRFYACLSDGWEDLTLFIEIADEITMEADDRILELANLIEQFNNHPYVTVTETLFTARLMAIQATKNAIDVSFNCRISPTASYFPTSTSLKTEITEGLGKAAASNGAYVSVSSVYGLTDFRVSVHNWQLLDEVGMVLDCLYDIESILRLDTRVSIHSDSPIAHSLAIHDMTCVDLPPDNFGLSNGRNSGPTNSEILP